MDVTDDLRRCGVAKITMVERDKYYLQKGGPAKLTVVAGEMDDGRRFVVEFDQELLEKLNDPLRRALADALGPLIQPPCP